MDDKQRMGRIYRKQGRAGLFVFLFSLVLGLFVLPALHDVLT